MNKKLQRIIINCLIALIFLSLTLYAATAQEDFDAYTTNNLMNTCPCTPFSEKLTISNTGAAISIFDISEEGDAADWITTWPNSVILAPGQVTEITRYVNANCGARGKYDFKTHITTRGGLTKSIKQTVNVENCNNIDVSIDKPAFSNCQCTPTKYSVTIKNVQNYADTFYFSTEPFTKYARFSQNSVYLEPGESKKIVLYIQLPCKMMDEYALYFLTRAEKSGFLEKTPIYLKIKECYDYTFKGKAVINVCEQEKTELDVSLINLADTGNTYELSVTGPEWLKLDSNIISVEGKEEDNLGLYAETPYESRGKYDITIDAASSIGEVNKRALLTLQAEECYNIGLILEAKKNTVCCSEKSYNVIVSNNGIKAVDMVLSADSDINTYFEDADLTLEPGEEKTATLVVSPTCEELGSHDIKITASIDNENVWYSESTSITVDVASKEACYLPGVWNNIIFFDEKIVAHYEENIHYLRVKNNGIMDTEYTFSIIAPEFAYLLDNVVSINSGKKGIVRIYTNATEEDAAGVYNITLIAQPTDDDTSFATEIELVLRERTAEDDIIYSLDKTYNVLFREYLGLTIIGAILFVILLILLVGVVAKIKKKQNKLLEKKKKEEARREAIRKAWELRRKKLGLAKKVEAKKKVEKKVRKKDGRKSAFIKIILYIVLGLLLVGILSLATYYLTVPLLEMNETIAINQTNITAATTSTTISTTSTTSSTSTTIIEEAVNVTTAENVTGLAEDFFTRTISDYLALLIIAAVLLLALIVLIFVHSLKAKKEKIKPAKPAVIEKKPTEKPKVVKIKKKPVKKVKRVKKIPKILYAVLAIIVILLVSYVGYYGYLSTVIPLNVTITNETTTTIIDETTTTTIEATTTNVTTTTTPFEDPVTTTTIAPTTTTLLEPEQSFIYRSWTKNTKLEVNLDEYFYDPDFDELEYSYRTLEDMQNINVKIKDGIATFIPRRNWYGTETVIFIGDDGKGGVIYSPNMTLVVKDEYVPVDIWDYIRDSANYIFGAVLVMLLVIIIILGSSRKNRQKKGKSKK